MIAAIEGILDSRGDNWAIIKVGGVSLQVSMPTSTLNQLGVVGEKVQLYTHFHLKEDSIALYGFASKPELELFKMLIGVDGIGPKVALAILSASPLEQLTLAIASGNIDMLSQLPRVGKKTAQRLVLELKGKLDKGWVGVERPYLNEDSGEVMAALTNLGYSSAEAARAIAALSHTSALTLEDKIRLALKYLAPAQVVGG